VSETQLDSVATGATEPDAETGEANDVSDYSEEPGEADPAGEAEDVASADGALDESAVDAPAEPADGAEPADDAEPVDSVREEFQRELRMLPGDWYVVHSYAGYENRVKTNLESRISSLNMEDYIYQIEVPVHMVTEIKGGKIEFRTDRHGNLHFIIGKASFPSNALLENYAAALDEVIRLKPAAAKGRYLKKVTFTTTMGPGIPVDPNKTRNFTDELAEATA